MMGFGGGFKALGFEGACVFLYPMPSMSFKQLALIHSRGSGFIPSVELVFLVQFLEKLDGVIVMKMFGLVLASFFLSIITESLSLSQRFFRRVCFDFCFCFCFLALLFEFYFIQEKS